MGQGVEFKTGIDVAVPLDKQVCARIIQRGRRARRSDRQRGYPLAGSRVPEARRALGRETVAAGAAAF